MPKFRENKPTADILMISMRSMGYSFEAAIADIVDNSISAKANKIEIKFPVEPSDNYIAICDNGIGMNADELFDAMKYGSQMKGSERDASDLGRFGLGLKAASLSQCRRLTVISKQNHEIASLCWDLDIIESQYEKDWTIIEYGVDEIKNIPFSGYLEVMEQGTIVLWENFDLIEKESGSVYHELSKNAEITANYLSLIFHRFLNRDQNNISIYINSFKLSGLDPFLEKHKKTNPRREIKLPINDSKGIERYVRVQPFVLPFQKDLAKEDIRLIGGIEDYRTKQGFYIYRNDRLIIWGTWFGRPKNELTKHARVKVDIPNTLDDIWGIDIKKQTAKIPRVIRHQLTKAVDEAMDIAVKYQTYRGRVEKVDEDIDYIWDRIAERESHYVYKINRESRIFDLIKTNVDDSMWNIMDMILEEIENGIPYQQIYIDKSQNRILDEITHDRICEVEAKADILINMAMSLGQSDRGLVIEKLFQSEPFNKYPGLKNKLLCEESKDEC